MFENRVLREVFESKRNEVTGEWRRLHNEELYGFLLLNKYFSMSEMKESGNGKE